MESREAWRFEQKCHYDQRAPDTGVRRGYDLFVELHREIESNTVAPGL